MKIRPLTDLRPDHHGLNVDGHQQIIFWCTNVAHSAEPVPLTLKMTLPGLSTIWTPNSAEVKRPFGVPSIALTPFNRLCIWLASDWISITRWTPVRIGTSVAG